jgi:dihydrolipoamide dehydrogenase
MRRIMCGTAQSSASMPESLWSRAGSDEEGREERDRFVGFTVDAVESWLHAHRIRARATFVSDHELALSDGSRIKADRIVIATGSRPVIPAMLEGLGDRLFTSDNIFEMTDLPKSAAVFGLGVIGWSLARHCTGSASA